MEFNKRLQCVLDQKKLKQISLCELTGLSSAQVHHLVSGRTHDPKLSTVVKIADALDVSLDYLAGRKQTPEIRLSTDEKQLVSNYRDSTPDRKRILQQTAHDSAVMSKDMEEREVSKDKSKAV